MDDADGETDVLGVGGALEHAVTDAETLVADPLEAEVGVAGPQAAGPVEGHVAEVPVGERGEGGIEHAGHGPNLADAVAVSGPRIAGLSRPG